ncbi:hypothetical protein [Chitinophaga pinensis]|uniref:DUF1795 domain-containing protein n=1 Tax=Chitinophaga pinensis (strain ATCC 43595 / DSM 2588 / LMG 13176 / NBRC 15968 / NCIMB 11800 / UQM 2034) TaxID=485918 RepID=A0A979G2N4_CHIPD|nr:hypothetical protein [Chitinophaga pinensis]ACU59566.1 hypothetical protein Cpin_2073 [Chitinophaga pinensis DSM 2588]
MIKCIVITLLVSMMACTAGSTSYKSFDFSDNSIKKKIVLPLPLSWDTLRLPEFLDDHLIFNKYVGEKDSSAWMNVRIYNDSRFNSADLNSLLNWQLEDVVNANSPVKVEKHIGRIGKVQRKAGILSIAYPGDTISLFSREIIIHDKAIVILLSVVDKKNEKRIEEVFRKIKSEIDL